VSWPEAEQNQQSRGSGRKEMIDEVKVFYQKQKPSRNDTKVLTGFSEDFLKEKEKNREGAGKQKPQHRTAMGSFL
jgi:hypothetical protein